MKWTEQMIRDRQKAGTIRGYKVNHRPKQSIGGKIVSKHFQKRSKEKDWMGWNLLFWANEHAVHLQEEYRFDLNGRKWRFDYCFEALKIGIEYNGIMSHKSRHTSIKGYSGDMQKINAASKQGWIILQYTPLNYRDVLKDLDEIWNKMHNNAIRG